MPNFNHREPTFPLSNSSRHKPRRLPLVLRFVKGAVHGVIVIPVILHAIFTALIVALDFYVGNLGLPNNFVPSLSIVVGLMLVFRNGTSYDRFWQGRNHFTAIITSSRNLCRSFLTNCSKPGEEPSESERADTEKIVRTMIAILHAVKSNLRAEWTTSPTTSLNGSSLTADASIMQAVGPGLRPEFSGLLDPSIESLEDRGIGLPLQLTVYVEAYIRRALHREWISAPYGAGLTAQLNTLVQSYGAMETIRTTPIPVAHLIHQKQVLALYTCVLPFAMVDELGWWSIPIVSLVAFTLYGIEGIGSQLEDPFGYDRNDIKMDAIVEDARTEIGVLLDEWRGGSDLFM
ncbi:UPF0187-domain-containing protein [Patellaria atrata CBS 101060]|uniref:UPF0187-domain-containing protein n=1 Tax=Patellaria atrata CBS 101060 TaxID=1346257 RepID=A0A9P4S4E5_9PEZI|nr:UPF0187-domain-containing protein [Patellaria atrata CBS 101060]